ncbi:outer membrane lipoprotein-sorting protein [Larkinella bovis]|uniref:Outer membrane lipoprotein-sorting protein n=1 Tax=Larkinella bovis TaxID=683041 RepID=A0ABW0I3Y4_9BACT
MKTTPFGALAIAFFLSFCASAQTVDEIIDKHVTALGGLDKLNGVKSLYTERTLSVQGMEIPNKTTVVVGKAIRSESVIMESPMVQVLTGATGWMIRPSMMGGSGKPEDMPADMVKQQISQLDPFGPLVNYREKGHKVDLVGQEKIDGKDVYHLRITTKEGQVVDEFIDAGSNLIRKVRMTFNGQPGEMFFADYRDVEGIKFANKMEMANDQAGTLIFTTNKVTINAPVDDAIFQKPGQ